MNVFRLLRWRSPYTHPQSLQSLGTNHHLTVGRNNRYLTTKSDSIEDGELAYAKFGHFVDSGESDRSNKVKFVERVQIEVKAGKGGNGCISHEVLSPGKKRPNGGNGGKGGNVYVVGSNQIETLHFPTYHFNAGDGKHGGSNGMTGRNGKDVYIHVPLGTIITENIPEEFAEYFYYDYSNEMKALGVNLDMLKERAEDVIKAYRHSLSTKSDGSSPFDPTVLLISAVVWCS